MYYVYVLGNSEEMYIGSTNDLRRRISDHQKNRSASTRGKEMKLVYYEAFLSEKDARVRETKLKDHGQSKRWLKERIRNSLKQI